MKEKFEIDFLNESKIEEIAEEFRSTFWDSRIPIDIELIIEKRLKLDLIPVSQMKRDYGIEAFISLNMKEIYYDSNIIETRIRFSMAHEIGHMVLHKDSIAELRSDDYREYRENINKIPASTIDRAEIQASAFASYLLMPSLELEKQVEQYIFENKVKVSALKPLFKSISNDNLYESFAMEIGKIFDVSTLAAAIRMRKSKLDIKGIIKNILHF